MSIKQDLKNVYSELPLGVRIGGYVVAGVLAYRLGKRAWIYLNNPVASSVARAKAAGWNVTLTKQQFYNMVQNIKRGGDYWGTNERLIESTLSQLKNPLDWYELVSAFGTYSPNFWDSGYTLQSYLQKEYDSDEDGKDRVNQIMMSREIPFRIL